MLNYIFTSKRFYEMIINTHVSINVVGKTIKYWLSKGYTSAAVGETLTVRVEDLQKNSNIYVECQCETCDRKYKQRYSRVDNICGSCKTSTRMKKNTLGSKNKKYIIPKKEQMLFHIEKEGCGKASLAKIYNVSIPVIDRWLKEHSINLSPYYGKLYFKNEDDKSYAIESIKSKSGMNMSEIAKSVGIPRHIIKKMKQDGHVDLKTQFDIWEESYSKILDKLDFYKKENKIKNLKTISDENNISIEQLKKAFVENNIQVRLHSYNKSKGETECLDFIKSLGESCYSAMLDKKFEIDCYVPTKHFGVEYCGEFWHRFVKSKNNKHYHRNKMRFAKERNVFILTIFESEWMTKKDIVKSIIRSKLGHSKKIYARKCMLREITKREAEAFHQNNHISGSANSSINIGLFHNDILVSVLSFIKSRFDKEYEYEISRFSSLLNYTIVGGLSKMFSYFVKTYKPSSCMTYSDLRIGEGKSYEKIGFICMGETPPNYFYYHKNKKYLESRMLYQKHKLKKLMPLTYSDHKSESQIMEEEGYYKIYDCGNKKYGWRNNPHP